MGNFTNTEKLKYLLLQYREQSLNPEELQELLALTQAPPGDELLTAVATLIHEEANAATTSAPEKDILPLIAKVLAVDKIRSATIKNQSTNVHRLFTTKWVAVAAITVAALLTAGIFYLLPHVTSISSTPVASNITSGKPRAVLTLADGTRVTLDSVSNGIIAVQKGASVVIKNGVLAYHQDSDATGETAYNTMSTPNGRKFSIALPDGSIAWLNAASTIRYPVAFTQHERNVEITGEVYFEIAGKANQPFKVHIKNAGEITVLGTTFNVNAYNNTRIKTTLLEGKVSVAADKISPNTNQVILQPGEQAQIQTGGKITLKKQVNTAQVIAWRHDIFNFEDADLEDVLGEISRWYDVTIVTTADIPDMRFEGQVNNAIHLPELLDILKSYGVNCRLEGRNLIILPMNKK